MELDGKADGKTMAKTREPMARTDGRTNGRPNHHTQTPLVPERARGTEDFSLAEVFDSLPLMRDDRVGKRLTVNNREARLQPSRGLWGALMGRDKGRCWICGQAARRPVVDHVIPRSSFTPDTINQADRSDNLAITCWDCNTEKGNTLYVIGERPLPVAGFCFRCYEGHPQWPDETGLLVYCAFCHQRGQVGGWAWVLSCDVEATA